MARFTFKAKRGSDEIVSGDIDAESQEHAVNALIAKGLVPISVAEKGVESPIETPRAAPTAQPDFRTRQLKLSFKNVNIFTQQLSSLVNAGVPILRSLTLIAQQTQDSKLQILVTDLEQQIKKGKSLSEAMTQYPNVFNSLYLSLIKAGETSGALSEALENLLEYREKEQDMRQKVQGAMAYPIFTLLVGCFTVFFMIAFCMPKLTSLFDGMNRDLPVSTQMLIGIGDFMSVNWYWFVLIFVLGLLVFGRSKEGRAKAIIDYLKLNVPLFNTFLRNAEIAKFSRTLSLLIKNGLSLFQSLDLATEVLENMMLKERLRSVRDEISRQGSTLSHSLRRSQALPNFVVNMIAVGEESGKLDHVLGDVARHYEKEVEQGIKLITSLLEPIFLLIVGAIVGFIVLSMLLPIFDMGTSIR